MERLIDNTMRLNNNLIMTSQGQTTNLTKLAKKILFSTPFLFALLLFYGCLTPSYSFSIWTSGFKNLQYIGVDKEIKKEIYQITYYIEVQFVNEDTQTLLKRDTTIQCFFDKNKEGQVYKTIRIYANDKTEAWNEADRLKNQRWNELKNKVSDYEELTKNYNLQRK